MGELSRVLDVQQDAGLVKVEAGIGMRALSELIWGYDMALENLGDIDRQTISGAVSTAQLDWYLDEFNFRFNRRRATHRGLLFYRLLEESVVTPPLTYRSVTSPPPPAR